MEYFKLRRLLTFESHRRLVGPKKLRKICGIRKTISEETKPRFLAMAGIENSSIKL